MRLDAVSVNENNMRERSSIVPAKAIAMIGRQRSEGAGSLRVGAFFLRRVGLVGASTSAGSASKEGALHMAIEVRARRVGRTSRRGEYRLKLLVGTYCRAKHNTCPKLAPTHPGPPPAY